jgi:hypothetical protein
VHGNAAPAERQRDAAGADAELERGARPCQLGEETHGRLDDLRLEHVGRVRVVLLCDAFVEVDLRHGRTLPALRAGRDRFSGGGPRR